TLIPDTLALAVAYPEGLTWGGGCGRFGAWGVFERGSLAYNDRYMPAGVLATKGSLEVSDIDESLITEYVGHSWYAGDGTYQAPDFTTDPSYKMVKKDDYLKVKMMIRLDPSIKVDAEIFGGFGDIVGSLPLVGNMFGGNE
ncbi:MAG: nickel-dependent hydrogenase large subunit, partial [Prevotella sp.]